MGRERRTLRGVELQADRVAEMASRPVAALRRRDVAIALLSIPPEDALASLPGWSIVDAVKNRRIAVISEAVNRPAPRIISAIEDLARQLHPDAFAERPEGSKEKLQKENPPTTLPPSPHSSFSPDAWQARIPGGCA